MAAWIITVFNQKGGVGKTRVSSEIAGTLGWQGHKTLLVDLDPQGTATRSGSQANENSPFPATITNLGQHDKPHLEIRKHITDYDFIVIDCPPQVASKTAIALKISDLGIIPLGGSAGELWASQPAKQLGIDAQEVNPALKLRAISNNAPRTNLTKSINKTLEKDKEIPLMRTRISPRNAYRESEALGQAVVQINGPSNIARMEIEALVQEIREILGEKGENV